MDSPVLQDSRDLRVFKANLVETESPAVKDRQDILALPVRLDRKGSPAIQVFLAFQDP